MKTLNEQIEVMQAYAAGKLIECKSINFEDDWDISDTPSWNWASFDYRISPIEVQNKYLADLVNAYLNNGCSMKTNLTDAWIDGFKHGLKISDNKVKEALEYVEPKFHLGDDIIVLTEEGRKTHITEVYDVRVGDNTSVKYGCYNGNVYKEEDIAFDPDSESNKMNGYV